MTSNVLVTGATGTVGAHVVRELAARGVAVRAFARDAQRMRERLGDLAHDRVEIVTGDFADAPSLRRALHGVDAMFLACGNQPRQLEHETAAIDVAAATGGRRVVKLSALGAQIGSPLAFWDIHGRIERHLQESAVPAVVLRPTSYMTNVLAAGDSVHHDGRIFAPVARARIAMIDPSDVAAVAAIALTDDSHDGRTYELTGPDAITYEDAADVLSAALGRRVEFVDVPDDAARHALAAASMPPWLAENVVVLFGLLRRSVMDRTTDDVARLTGRAPRTFAGFARDHAAMFAGPGAAMAAAF